VAVFTIWIVCLFIESTYKLYWDNIMDWGVLNLSSKHFLLRDKLTFPKWVCMSETLRDSVCVCVCACVLIHLMFDGMCVCVCVCSFTTMP
jgi:hypothetical protein